MERMNAQPTEALSPEPQSSEPTTHNALRCLANDLLPLKRDHVGRTPIPHLVLGAVLTMSHVLGKHLPSELQNEESAEGLGSREAAISSAFEGTSVRKVIFLGSLRQVSGEECDDGWS